LHYRQGPYITAVYGLNHLRQKTTKKRGRNPPLLTPGSRAKNAPPTGAINPIMGGAIRAIRDREERSVSICNMILQQGGRNMFLEIVDRKMLKEEMITLPSTGRMN
jgi:hypothetical protein